jgi:glycosyltransferase involved in cell wall biosynthesis
MSQPVDDGGCGWYRVRQPFESIKRFTPDDAYIIDPHKDNMEEVVEAMGQTQVMVMRPGAEAAFWMMKNKPEFSHLKWVMDIDDNIEQISPYNYHYQDYGVEDFYDKNIGAWLWKHGERNWDAKKNLIKLQNHLNVYKHVDMITVTTPLLASYAKQYNDNVVILPNCINFERWWKLPLKKNRIPRVGWSGGISHYEDWHSIKEPLNELMREHPFRLIVAGNDFKGIVDEDNRHLVESHDWVPFKGHPYRMMVMNLDVAVIP